MAKPTKPTQMCTVIEFYSSRQHNTCPILVLTGDDQEAKAAEFIKDHEFRTRNGEEFEGCSYEAISVVMDEDWRKLS
jgi:hypothetical protein